jgi:hypothetical protein
MRAVRIRSAGTRPIETRFAEGLVEGLIEARLGSVGISARLVEAGLGKTWFRESRFRESRLRESRLRESGFGESGLGESRPR